MAEIIASYLLAEAKCRSMRASMDPTFFAQIALTAAICGMAGFVFGVLFARRGEGKMRKSDDEMPKYDPGPARRE